jgi:hypothetical protein
VASVWLGAGADPKEVQRVLGHATASMTMDLYGHLVDGNLWQAAQLVGGTTGASEPPEQTGDDEDGAGVEEVPGSGGALGGAAYRNRTDDLRITSASL